MTTQVKTVQAGSSSGGARAQLAAPSPDVMAEVERLLAGRTRDVHLTGELRRLFHQRSWPQTAKIIRSWMTWMAILNVLMLAVSFVTLPRAVTAAMLLPASTLLLVAVALLFIWRNPHPYWLQRSALAVGMFLILLSVALLGFNAGGEFYERYLDVMLFVAITGIIIFSVPLPWTILIAAAAVGLYVVFQFQNPAISIWSAVNGALFFASGIIATVVARRTMTILAQKAFLLELRDRKRVADLAKANQRLEHLARTDPLTGAANRRWMKEILDDLWVRCKATPAGAALLMCDLDDFKNLNDHLGHAEGDRCLVEVARVIKGCLRQDQDRMARYGGEEFLVVLPATGERDALEVAERIRMAVESAGLCNPTSRVSPSVTLSIGVAVKAPGAGNVSPEQLQRQADAALYLAKQAGRNQVVVHRPMVPAPVPTPGETDVPARQSPPSGPRCEDIPATRDALPFP
ncbi:GGDEF domain-containing protein [Aurantimonas endophytica]|uniref:GGDEF domain-containing protein n=1 Tax=Aurantimonas endophytica TaxID=1522175 RepID=UPI003AB9B302